MKVLLKESHETVATELKRGAVKHGLITGENTILGMGMCLKAVKVKLKNRGHVWLHMSKVFEETTFYMLFEPTSHHPSETLLVDVKVLQPRKRKLIQRHLSRMA
uniref:Uncharacterized protein n=1 Tax=Crocodylus porosus TaxID=8502 RepID=A0A7M4EUA9_CROPO